MVLLSSPRFLRGILPAAALTVALLSPVVSHATLINFDDLTCGTWGISIPANYAGLTWSNFYCLNGVDIAYNDPNSGYVNGTVSPNNVAFNGMGSPANFSISSPGESFTLNSAYLTAAMAIKSDLNLQVQAYRSGSLVSTTNHVLQSTAPILVNFNLVNVDQVIFTSSGGVGGDLGNGTQFVMDNLVVNEAASVATVNPVPTLSQWGLLLLSGLLGALALRTRRRHGG